MKKTAIIIILILCISLVASLMIFTAGCTPGNNIQEGTNVLSSPIKIGESVYTLSKFNVSDRKYHLVFTGNVPDEAGKDLATVSSYGSPPKVPYITYNKGDGNEGTIEKCDVAFVTTLSGFEYECFFNNVPKDLNWVTVTFTYKNQAGENVEFTTPKIELKE